MTKLAVDEDVAHPEEDPVVVGSGARADFFSGPAVLAIEGVRAVGSAGVLEAQCLDLEGIAFTAVIGQQPVGEAVLLKRGDSDWVGLGWVGN